MSAEPESNILGTPSAEVEIDALLVDRLLAEQHSDLQSLPIQFVDAGWDNSMFRLGSRLAVRLPRRSIAANLLRNEQIWLPQLAERLSLPVPAPYRIGNPSPLYPWHWSVIPWFSGETVDRSPLDEDQAPQFARFLQTLHVPAPKNAPVNPYRGIPLSQKVETISKRIQHLENSIDSISPELRLFWQEASRAPIDIEPTWIHGDLHPRNILVENGKICGAIDWGDMAAGDRSTDLAAFWFLFPNSQVRQEAISAYGKLSEATLVRAKGWAIFFGITLLDSGLVNCPRHAAIGRKILQCVASDL
jgi:aminoglycoside phosphotransferase (APT) family kinase protein